MNVHSFLLFGGRGRSVGWEMFGVFITNGSFNFILIPSCYTILESVWPGEGCSTTKTSTNNCRKDLEGKEEEAGLSGCGYLWSFFSGFYAINVGTRNKKRIFLLFCCTKSGSRPRLQ